MSDHWAEEGHYRELDRHHQLVSSVNVPLTASVALGGVNFVLLSRLLDLVVANANNTFVKVIGCSGGLVIIVSFIFLVACIRALFMVYASQAYSAVPPAINYDNYRKELLKYYKDQGHDTPWEQAKQETERYRQKAVMETEEINFNSNFAKEAWRYSVSSRLFWSAVLTLVAAGLWFLPEAVSVVDALRGSGQAGS